MCLEYYAFISTKTHQTLGCRINRTGTDVSRQNFPNVFWLEKYVRLCVADVVICFLGGDFERFQLIVKFGQLFFAKAGSDLADGLVFLRVGVVTSEEVGSVPLCALASAIIPPDNGQVKTIARALEVVLLNLK